MDKLDRIGKIKKFFRAIYKGITGEEVIRIAQFSEYNTITNFNDIDMLCEFCATNCFNKNTYFELSTTNGNSGQSGDLLYRYCLGFDFDKKDFDNLTYKDILAKFKGINLWYHALIDSGHGYHAYVCIEKTGDLEKVNEVQRAIAEKIGADLNAVKKTQLLRVPYTFNVKDKEKVKQVNIVNLFDKNSIKPYSINKLHNRFCSSFRETDTNTDNFVVVKRSNIPPCVSNALENGSVKGNRNRDLYNIIVYLKNNGENFSNITRVINEWNDKNKEKVSDSELEYQLQYIYNNCSGYRCANCDEEIKLQCKSYVVSDFNLEQYGEQILNIHTKVGRQCKINEKKGVVNMTGNELFIYNVLLNNKDMSLSMEDITKLITDRKTNKVALTEKYVRQSLKGLEEKEYIIVNKGVRKLGIADRYMINPKKVTEENSIRISYFANIMVIKGHITTTELRCYMRMRYLHHEQVKKGKAKGNIFTITMEDLAKSLGYKEKNHSEVSRMVKNLYENNILDRSAIACQDHPETFYYQYKLNM